MKFLMIAILLLNASIANAEYMNKGSSGLIYRLVDFIPETKKHYSSDDIYCLALNIYHEGRSESLKGRVAIGLVTLNRVQSKAYPNTICKVVKQRSQFSWYWDGKHDTPLETAAFNEALLIAAALISDDSNIYDFTQGSLWYHADYIKPSWAKNLQKVVQIDTHIFYKE